MSRVITVYEAEDGSRHDTAEAAEKRNQLVARCDHARDWLRSVGGLQHGTYRDHGIGSFLSFKAEVVRIAREETAWFDGWAKVTDDLSVDPFSVFGRVVSDHGGPVAQLWHQLMCFNDEGREYDQPYFVHHPHEAVPA